MKQLEIKITFTIPEGQNILLLLRSITYFFWAGIIQRAGGTISHNYTDVSEITLERIHQIVSKKTGISEAEMLENTRKRQVVEARQIAMFLSREMIKPEPCTRVVGEYYNRDHATVLYACEQVRNLASTEKRFSEQLTAIRNSLT
jgi:chromosomal replication initiation ATPase DnaA